ncbi:MULTISPECIES: ribonuclease Z [unclassified Kitasatospora]|uniref:ribonuclease Z n=1 Tax=unclassified Kitasatospora TaxID=2633591 RepID=UPI00070F3F61|nr:MULTISPECIES: ribonuclease Z [unclassified Kitasatospora]KQV05504.1 ribonuclease Z [Kitasatospora sp. Root107]KRB62309.1 ribonuclease Z [Kitasatospora sp. Root187]
MSQRELVVLGTASQVPTRHRNHNGYLLRWDGEGLLFDPGEGTQRQMLHAGISATQLTRIAVTHFHGDHSLGLAGVIQRINLDRVPHPVDAYYPASGQMFFDRLRQATAFHETAELRPHPIEEPGPLSAPGAPFELAAVRLSHPVDSFGYRLTEPDSTRLLPAKLAEFGLRGPAVGQLQREGRIELAGRTVTLAEVSEVRRGQRFAFVMDTRLCDGVGELAEGADLLVIEATFLESEAQLAEDHGHLTAGQAARAAAEAGVRTLVLTHFSQRYPDLSGHLIEARKYFDGELVVAEDLARVAVPARL